MYGTRFSENAGQSFWSFLQEEISKNAQPIKQITSGVIEDFGCIGANVLKAKVWRRLVRLKNTRILAILKAPQNSAA
jgi:hypothetical protein